MASASQSSVVLIDDNAEQVAELRRAIETRLAADEVIVRVWTPADGENAEAKFNEVVDSSTVLVVTDYDLTKTGLTGLFGVSIVSWCQARFVPVGDFSRGNRGDLPREPNLFELRIPANTNEAASYTAAMYRGFRDVRGKLEDGTVDFLAAKSPAEVLGAVIGRPPLEGQLALYMSLLGGANASLLDSLRWALSHNGPAAPSEKVVLLSYVVGHILANAVLRYPGPILSEIALCAYVATTQEEIAAISELFVSAKYDGPFGDEGNFYWRDEVDAVTSRLSESMGDSDYETSGEFNRAVMERALGRPIARHQCPRCDGINGGYLCPFTDRPVCERADCSVAANSWVPPGADVCRVEREFYDEWAPLLGY